MVAFMLWRRHAVEEMASHLRSQAEEASQQAEKATMEAEAASKQAEEAASQASAARAEQTEQSRQFACAKAVSRLSMTLEDARRRTLLQTMSHWECAAAAAAREVHAAEVATLRSEEEACGRRDDV